MNKAILGIAVAAGVLLGVMLLRQGTDAPWKASENTANAGAAVTPRQSPEAVLTIAPGAPTAARQPRAAARLSPLMQEYAAGKKKDLYDRLSKASSRTAEEDFVLADLLDRCGQNPDRKPRPSPPLEEQRNRFVASVSAKDPARDKRIAAFDRSHAPQCEGFEGVKTTDAEIRALLEKAAAAGDPKARAWLLEKEIYGPFMSPDGGVRLGRTGPGDMPTITDAQYATLREAVASNDPYVLMSAARLLASTMTGFAIQVGPDQRPIDPRAFFDAWNLAACNAGYDCGPNHATILQACANFGNCDAHDLREHLFFYGHSPQQSQLIDAYQTQIANAIRTGDWSYFTVNRGQAGQDSVFVFGGR